ncbi:probable prefoldin subunit 4 [Tribolium castaneum]|uniref:Prefoldin subunit 4 n=1 Tax=Tribolium castaneum TaxID=7070 RepID=D6X221_TRICA|nr:PREDICTED: probable prefoldin subunit 4 [Tribolium castaneum]EFA09930.1 putative prefoldin subunit 4-like Protein [Tribolium castaneum]|eukprot:XP_972645.1 PREDICTED: probable prefoldin subunit 4 [Tribolium castaneum]
MAGSKGTFQPDSDVHISYEDQQKINKFARLNAKLEDLKEEVKVKENDLKSLEEACDEIALFDEEEKIPYLVGEVFILQDTETTQQCLDDAKKKIDQDIKELKSQSDDVKSQMSDLKSHLYGKFGSHINLEAEEE